MRTLQILFDKRQPLFVPYQFIKALLLRKHIRKATIPRQIFVLITVDVENSWGNEEQESQKENGIFLKIFLEIRDKNTTFFLPGNLVANLKTTLKQLADENELGLHGHHHELWRSAHFVEKKAIKDKEKKELIVSSLSEFKRSDLNRPTSFRSPYMWCKNKDLKFLEEMGFQLDSSDRSQNGTFKIRKEGKILRIPVTVNPFPQFKKRRAYFQKMRLTKYKENSYKYCTQFGFLIFVFVILTIAKNYY